MILRIAARCLPINICAKALGASRPGQVIVAMLGIMAFALVVGLAVSSRVVTALRQVSYSTQSAEALAFAEAGVEHSLKCLADGSCTVPSGGSLDVDGDGRNDVDYSIENFGVSATYIDVFSPIQAGRVVQVNLDGYPAGRPVYINWVRLSMEEISSRMLMEASLIYYDPADGRYKTVRGAWEPRAPLGGGRFDVTEFWEAPVCGHSCLVGGVQYLHRVGLSAPPGTQPKLLRFRMLYSDTPNSVAVSTADSTVVFPLQGTIIQATGYSGRVRRRLQVARTLPMLPETFDFVYFSGEESLL